MKIYCHIIFYFFLIGNISCTTSKKTIKNKDSKNIVSKQESRIKKLLIEGTTEKIIGNLNEADSLFKMCLTIAPKNAVCFYELSGISLQKNEIEDALAFAEKAADYQPKNEWYKLNLALIFIENKKEKEAIKIFEELTFEHPERYEYLYSLSDSYINVGEYKKDKKDGGGDKRSNALAYDGIYLCHGGGDIVTQKQYDTLFRGWGFTFL